MDTNLGVVTKIYSSGMVQTDKGYKAPCGNAQLGDVMFENKQGRYCVTEVKPKRRRAKKEETRKENARNEEEQGEKDE